MQYSAVQPSNPCLIHTTANLGYELYSNHVASCNIIVQLLRVYKPKICRHEDVVTGVVSIWNRRVLLDDAFQLRHGCSANNLKSP